MKWSTSLLAASTVGISICQPSTAQVTQRVSLSSTGSQGNLTSWAPRSSADGRFVAFLSIASDLIPGDTNGTWDIFVRDRQLGTTERVSVDSSGAQGNGSSGDPDAPFISSDGRYVAFTALASNLVPGDTNGVFDVFVHDRLSGTTERVSVNTTGTQGNDRSYYPSMTADGRYVAFYSFSTNLVPGDTNGVADVFIRDRVSLTTERVSVNSSGGQGNARSLTTAISDDGNFVAFFSEATNLVPGDTNGVQDVFVRNRMAGTTERVSVDSGGVQANGVVGDPSLSADGRYVAFTCFGSNLVAGDTNGESDVFVHDCQTGTTECVSVDSNGVLGNGASFADNRALSADGRYVVYSSVASNLVTGDTNGVSDVFVHDRQTGRTDRVSVDPTGLQGNAGSEVSAISANGRHALFSSDATNLVTGDSNGSKDAFIHDRDAIAFTSLCDPGIGGVIPCPCSNPPAGSGRGCDNFGAGPTDSGTLTATGAAYLSEDTVVLHATGENNTSLTVFWTGTALIAPPGVVHGAGVRCVSGLKRLYSGSASGGAISRPGMGDQSVSDRSAAVGASISAGQTRYYFTVYRDPLAATPCGNTTSTVNLTNAGSITWNL